MLFNAKKLNLIDKGFIRFNLPEQSKPTSRDIVWAKFSHKKEVFFLPWSIIGQADEAELKKALQNASKHLRKQSYLLTHYYWTIQIQKSSLWAI
jgi:hypothetical protein